LSPLPVLGERVRVRVIWFFENLLAFKITLTPALSWSSGRGRKT